jgi:NTP pyrophosphatase (non-canonical NTP hydrolase)
MRRTNKLEIKGLTNDVHENAKAHGWWDEGERNVGELFMLCVTELSEAYEEYRNGREMNETYYKVDKQGNEKMEGVPSELADTVIRIMDLCGYFKIDLEKAILEKHEYNKGRPYKHGGKRA